MPLFNSVGRNTPLVVVTQDADETQWEMVPAYQVADYFRESLKYGEYQVLGVYQLELSNTGGTVAPITWELEHPEDSGPHDRVLRFFPDQQDAVEFHFNVDPQG